MGTTGRGEAGIERIHFVNGDSAGAWGGMRILLFGEPCGIAKAVIVAIELDIEDEVEVDGCVILNSSISIFSSDSVLARRGEVGPLSSVPDMALAGRFRGDRRGGGGNGRGAGTRT